MAFTGRAKQSGLIPAMGSIGDCYNNAVIEFFWSRTQTPLTGLVDVADQILFAKHAKLLDRS